MKNTLLLCLCLLSLPFSAQNRYYVDDTAGGQNTGASWADALTDLQTALALAQSGDEVWVAEGTYLPTTGADRNISFQPASGVRLYGGFAGTESAPDERDWEAHPTVLSGDIGAPGDSTDNTYNVVYLYQPDAGTLLDGFTICFGNADFGPGAGNERDRVICGGGLYMDAGNWDALATIQYCRFWRNTALSYGGGAMVTGSTAAGVAPKWLHCRFEENRSAGSGGGLARFGGSWEEQGVDFEACDFIGNRAGFLGGGLYYSDSQGPNTVMINQCVFEHNFAVSRGGGAFLLMGKAGLSGLVVNGCDFDSNASTDGAALDVFPNLQDYTGNFSIEDCIFQKNNINYSGEKRVIVYIGIFGSENTTASINNAIFEHNQSEESLLIDCYNSNVIVDNVEFYSNQASRIIVTFSATSQFFTNIQFNSNITGLFYGLDSNQETVSYVKNCICINNEPINQNIIYFNPTGIFDSLIVTNFTIDDSSIANEISTVETNFIAQNMVVNSVNNLFTHTLTQYDISHSSFNLPDCTAFPPNVTCGPGNLFGLDPMFRDTANGDYSLLPCSPLRNRGNNAAAAGILTDIAGMPRIQDGTVDIGAYETPALALAEAPLVQPACAGSANGSIQLQAAGACLPVSWQWSPPVSTGPELYGLPPGNYAYTLSDNAGIQLSGAVVVPEAPQPELSLAAQDILCNNGLGGALTASVGGGTAPFQYLWQPAAPDTAALGALPPGDYALTLSDANGCRDSAAATLSLLGALTLQVDGAPISCYAAADGWLSATPLTGAAPWTWVWQGWPGMESVAEPLGPGLYAVTVSDAYGCTAAFTFPPMDEPDSLWLTADSNPQTDLSQPDGSALVTTISGGTPGYAFDWNTGAMSQVITGLTAGVYTVTITDARGCTASLAVTVDLMTGTEQAGGLEAFVLYPNPAAEWVRILLPETAAKNGELQLYDAAGRRLHTRTLDGSPVQQLSLETLPAGPYRLLITRNGRVVWETGVVKRGGDRHTQNFWRFAQQYSFLCHPAY